MLKSLFVLSAALALTNHARAGIDDLGWLAGHWCGDNRGTFNEEVWRHRARARDRAARDSAAGKLRVFEFFGSSRRRRPRYWTQPGGAPAIAFRAAVATADRVDFSNPAHDFPKRISYRRVDARTLLARIDDGTDGGAHMEWTWRLDCSTKP